MLQFFKSSSPSIESGAFRFSCASLCSQHCSSITVKPQPLLTQSNSTHCGSCHLRVPCLSLSLPLSLIRKPEPSPFPHTVDLLVFSLPFSLFLIQNLFLPTSHSPEKLIEITFFLYPLSLSPSNSVFLCTFSETPYCIYTYDKRKESLSTCWLL